MDPKSRTHHSNKPTNKPKPDPMDRNNGKREFLHSPNRGYGEDRKQSSQKNQKSKASVLVAMSGGVDSSVSAALLVEQGFKVIGVTMQVWDYSNCSLEEGMGTCCSSQDVDDAREVADKLKIPFYVLNCEDEFKQKVIDPFVKSYREGYTPLPCVNCNTHLKFHHLIKKMEELSCDHLATGHYARVEQDHQKRWAVTASQDPWKDQTYFLFTLDPKVIPKLIFPVGDMTKDQVRHYAKKYSLPVANKKDSVGLCFVGSGGYGKFIDDYESEKTLKKGLIKLYPSGQIIGGHSGIHHFTYGQRKRLGLSFERPLYVLKIKPKTNEIFVGEEEFLYSSEMLVDQCHWIEEPEDHEYLVKIRYSHSGAKAKVKKLDSGQIKVSFYQKQRAITPGQAAVFYKNNHLIGGGWIQ